MPGIRDRSRRRWRSRASVLFQALEPRTLLTSYYLSPTGNDAAAGTSSSAPWKNLTKINAVDLEPGDKVLLQGGATFTAPAASTTNLVSDSGFESGNLNSWTENFDLTAGSSKITTYSGDIHGGTKALKITGATDSGRGQLITSKVKSNKSYMLKLWGKLTTGTGAANAGITFYNGTTKIAESSIKISGTTYKQYTAAIVAPPSFTSADVWVTKKGGTANLFVDDFALNETFGTMIFEAS